MYLSSCSFKSCEGRSEHRKERSKIQYGLDVMNAMGKYKPGEKTVGSSWVIFKIRWPEKVMLSIDLKVIKKKKLKKSMTLPGCGAF